MKRMTALFFLMIMISLSLNAQNSLLPPFPSIPAKQPLNSVELGDWKSFPEMQVAALPHTDEEMYPVEYKIDLPASSATVFCISTKTLGVGSNSCGPRPLEKFQVFAEPASFTYTITIL